LKTGFCEIRFPRPAPVKAFGVIRIKKITQDPPERPEALDVRCPTKLYFLEEIHTQNYPADQTEGCLTAESQKLRAES
jgi:hypothetical protein